MKRIQDDHHQEIKTHKNKMEANEEFLKQEQNLAAVKVLNTYKIKIVPSVHKGHILISILVICLHLQRTKNDIRGNHLSGIIKTVQLHFNKVLFQFALWLLEVAISYRLYSIDGSHMYHF